MTRRGLAATALITVLASAIACSRQASMPASPTSAAQSRTDAAADGSTLKATAPSPIAPVNDQQVSDTPTLTAGASTPDWLIREPKQSRTTGALVRPVAALVHDHEIPWHSGHVLGFRGGEMI